MASIESMTTKKSQHANRLFESKKLMISIMLGLVGFMGSFYSLNFSNPPFTLTIIWSHFLPVLAGLAYGGRYGFVAGALGLGGLFPFFLWETNGWANLVYSAILVSWYSWQGYFESFRRNKSAFWNHAFIIYVPFAFLYVIAMRILYPLAFSFNPPFWNPQAELSMPLPVLNGIITTEVVLLYVWLVFAVFLLKAPFVRRILDLEIKKESRYNGWIVLSSFLSALPIWYVFVLFNRIFVDTTFPGDLFQFNDPHEIIALLVCLAVSFFIGSLLVQYMEAFLKNEEEFRLLAENSMDMISRHTPEGIYLYASPASDQLLGYSPDELVGRSAFDFIAPEDIPVVEQSRLAILDQQVVSTTRYRFLRKDGQLVWLETTSHTIRDNETGEAVELHANTRNVTERKQAEDALQKSEERYRLLSENAPDIVFRYALSPKPKLEYINPAVERITGYTPDDCYADPLLMLNMAHPDDAHLMAELMQSLGPLNKPVIMRWVGKDGVIRWMESRLAPVYDEAKQIIAVEGLTRDITERKEAEDARKESETRYRTLISNMPVVTFVLDENGLFILSEGKGLAKLGLEPGQVVGLSVFDVYRDYPLIIEPVKNAFLGQSYRNEVEVQGVVFDVTYTPTFNAQGKVERVIGVANDITERKQAEGKLKEQLDELRRWHQATLGREERIIDLKREVNELLTQIDKPPRYSSTEKE